MLFQIDFNASELNTLVQIFPILCYVICSACNSYFNCIPFDGLCRCRWMQEMHGCRLIFLLRSEENYGRREHANWMNTCKRISTHIHNIMHCIVHIHTLRVLFDFARSTLFCINHRASRTCWYRCRCRRCATAEPRCRRSKRNTHERASTTYNLCQHTARASLQYTYLLYSMTFNLIMKWKRNIFKLGLNV